MLTPPKGSVMQLAELPLAPLGQSAEPDPAASLRYAA